MKLPNHIVSVQDVSSVPYSSLKGSPVSGSFSEVPELSLSFDHRLRVQADARRSFWGLSLKSCKGAGGALTVGLVRTRGSAHIPEALG